MDKQVNGEPVDLGALVPADTAVLEIMKPGGSEGTGWKITFAGPAHEKTLRWSNDNARRQLRRQQQIEQAQANGRKYKAEDRDVDDVRAENVGWVVSRIVDWTPIKIAGEVIAFSDQAATALLVQPQLGWAFSQMVDFLSDERAFMQRSAKS